MAHVSQIASDVYRISVYLSQYNLQFNHFLVLDDEPLLYHTGLRQVFPELREGIGQIMNPNRLRWISWSHFESDECGALNQWLAIAPDAQPVCNTVGALVNVADYSVKPARILEPGETLRTGQRRFQYISTPHLPHGWDAGVLFEQTEGTMFCSDLLHQEGEVEPMTDRDVIGRTRAALEKNQGGPFADYVPYTDRTGAMLDGLAALQPATLATMHGSTYTGNCAQALRDLDVVFRDVLSGPTTASAAGR